MSSTCFEAQGFIFRKTVVCTGMVQCAVHADITMKGFCKKSKYKIFELFKYIDMNIKHSS